MKNDQPGDKPTIYQQFSKGSKWLIEVEVTDHDDVSMNDILHICVQLTHSNSNPKQHLWLSFEELAHLKPVKKPKKKQHNLTIKVKTAEEWSLYFPPDIRTKVIEGRNEAFAALRISSARHWQNRYYTLEAMLKWSIAFADESEKPFWNALLQDVENGKYDEPYQEPKSE